MAYTGNYSFEGLDARRAAQDGAIRDMTNMSRRFYPAIASRTARHGIGSWGTAFGGVYFGDRELVVHSGALYDDGTYVCPVTPGEKQMCVLENILYVFPDQIMYDTENGTVRNYKSEAISNVGNEYLAYADYSKTYNDESHHFCMFRMKRSAFDIKFKIGEYIRVKREWSIGSVSSGTLKNYSFDQVLQLMDLYAETISEEEWLWFRFPENSLEEFWAGKNVEAFPSSGLFYLEVELSHGIPDMDFVFASDNRLWGAKGRNIYASALGQGMVWQDYDTLTTSSWAATTATGDTVTAACDFGGMPVFFSENAVYKIYGENPKEYQYARADIVGVLAGEHKSVAVGAGYIFYLSRRGIYAWTGGVPQLISAPLGEERITGAVGGSDGAIYYLSCMQGGRHNLYTFDPMTGAWMREDDADAIWLGMRGRDMCMVTREGVKYLIGDVYSDEGTAEQNIVYSMETSDYNDGGVVDKAAKHILIQHELTGGTCEVLVSYDGEPWQSVYTLHDTDGKKITSVIPLHPGRYRTMRISLIGDGDIIIYYMVREVMHTTERPGGERNVYV